MNNKKSDRTRHEIEMAIRRIEHSRPRIIDKNRKLSIMAVAEEASLSTASIHNNYPDMVEIIRTKTNKATRQQRDEKHSQLKAEKEKNKILREQINTLTKQLRNMASENARLITENQQLNAIANNDNVHVLNKKIL